MNNSLIFGLCVLAVLVVVWLVLRKFNARSSSTKQTIPGVPNSVSADMAEAYLHATEPGKDGVPTLYALVTCKHCKRTKEFLDEIHAQYHLVYVDNFTGDIRKELMEKVRSYNPRGSFPTFVTAEGTIVVGFREQQLKEALHYEA